MRHTKFITCHGQPKFVVQNIHLNQYRIPISQENNEACLHYHAAKSSKKVNSKKSYGSYLHKEAGKSSYFC